MATAKHTAPAQAHRLTLVSFPPDRKVTVIKLVREHTGLGLKEAKDLVENLPAAVLLPDALDTLTGPAEAVATVEPIVTDPAAFQAGVERLREFDASPLGEALSDARDGVYEAIALVDVATRSLERDDGNGIDRETLVLGIARERLQAALEALDAAHSNGVRSQPAAELQS